jgi:hypothetical protein
MRDSCWKGGPGMSLRSSGLRLLNRVIAMRLEGPEQYRLTFTSDSFNVLCSKGSNKFSGIAMLKLPKLYIVSIGGKPIYVGTTKQAIRNRLRLGWAATGKSGYYGYAWRHGNTTAELDVWCHMDAIGRNELDIETVEAEVVFLIRQAGQWPTHQTEIHFHPSEAAHREAAASIMMHFKI